jgi:hypothetical protein
MRRCPTSRHWWWMPFWRPWKTTRVWSSVQHWISCVLTRGLRTKSSLMSKTWSWFRHACCCSSSWIMLSWDASTIGSSANKMIRQKLMIWRIPRLWGWSRKH